VHLEGVKFEECISKILQLPTGQDALENVARILGAISLMNTSSPISALDWRCGDRRLGIFVR
jgi:hypothetical protein